MHDQKRVIEHDPEEPPRDASRSPWGLLAFLIALLWAGYLYSFSADWVSIGLGFGTGGIFMAWGLEVTGNKVPASWRGKSTDTRRPRS